MGFDASDIGWSAGSGGWEGETDDAIPSPSGNDSEEGFSSSGREWRRMAALLADARERLREGALDACAAALADIARMARENASLADAEAEEAQLGAEETRRLADGMEP